LRGSAGLQPVFIVVCSVPQEAEHGRESVNPDKMKKGKYVFTDTKKYKIHVFNM